MWTPAEHQSFRAAVDWALQLHETQQRKISGVPFAAHLLAVASLVVDHGGTAEMAIAAVLHDAIEDQGGHHTAEEIRARFGPQVLALVEGCTDAWEDPKPPWQTRKEAFLARLAHAPAAVCLIIAADKVHNLHCLARDFAEHGPALWGQFRGGREGTRWYYHAVLQVIKDASIPHALRHELEQAYERFADSAGY